MHQIFVSESATDSEFLYESDAQITLHELLERICGGDERTLFKIVDETGALRSHVAIFIGTTNCRNMDGINTRIGVDEEVTVFPALSGG